MFSSCLNHSRWWVSKCALNIKVYTVVKDEQM